MTLSPLDGETHIGSAKMQTAAINNLILTDFSSFKRFAGRETLLKQAGLYQGLAQSLTHLLHANGTIANLATMLVRAADHAYAARDLDIVSWVGQLLFSLGFSRELESVGHYYQALSLNQGGRGDTTGAGLLFEQVADSACVEYRARALLALGTNSAMAGDRHTSSSLYQEVMRLASRKYDFEPVTLHTTSRMTAVIKSMEGDHQGALADLERMLPLARLASSVQPYAYYDYLNTLAVELCEVGRLEEARNASRIALASPFAAAYPEWHETREEIELRGYRASRSNVSVSKRSLDNLMRLPAREPVDSLASGSLQPIQPARVLSFLEGKKKMVKESNGPPEETKNYEDMDGKEILLKIMEITASSDRTDYELYQILRAIEAVVSKPKEPNK